MGETISFQRALESLAVISGHDFLFDLRKFQMIHGYRQNQANGKVKTPWKIDMEPENTLLERKNIFLGPSDFRVLAVNLRGTSPMDPVIRMFPVSGGRTKTLQTWDLPHPSAGPRETREDMEVLPRKEFQGSCSGTPKKLDKTCWNGALGPHKISWFLLKKSKVPSYDEGRELARPSNHAANGSSVDVMPSNACQKSIDLWWGDSKSFLGRCFVGRKPGSLRKCSNMFRIIWQKPWGEWNNTILIVTKQPAHMWSIMKILDSGKMLTVAKKMICNSLAMEHPPIWRCIAILPIEKAWCFSILFPMFPSQLFSHQAPSETFILQSRHPRLEVGRDPSAASHPWGKKFGSDPGEQNIPPGEVRKIIYSQVPWKRDFYGYVSSRKLTTR